MCNAALSPRSVLVSLLCTATLAVLCDAALIRPLKRAGNPMDNPTSAYLHYNALISTKQGRRDHCAFLDSIRHHDDLKVTSTELLMLKLTCAFDADDDLYVLEDEETE